MATKDAAGVDFSKCVGFKYDPVPVPIPQSSIDVPNL
jgi:hypothetical protein